MESYSTQLRTRGVGSTQTVGKLAGVLTPLIVLPIYFTIGYRVFLFLFIFGLVAHIILLLFPLDKTKAPLDNI
jgi:hypothetical protein